MQRDLRQLSQIDNLIVFEKFVRLLAGRTVQLLNYNSLANDLGESQPTIKKWVSLLEASYIVFLLPPFFKNIRKRLIKTPKIYFYDTGFASNLLGLENIKHISLHPLRGNLFENFIISELLKARFNQAKHANINFFRDRTGNEVDIIIEHALDYVAVEIKTSETTHKEFLKCLQRFESTFTDKKVKKYVVYGGNEKHDFHGTHILPWNKLDSLMETV